MTRPRSVWDRLLKNPITGIAGCARAASGHAAAAPPDVMVLPEEQCCSVPNDASGWAALVERLRNFSIMAIGLEASGGYERGVMRALLAAGMRQVNPFKLRQFARASGVLAKNDPLDARMIASFVGSPPLPTAHLDAGSRIAVGLHADRALARARPHESQTSRCSGWCCALRLRERHAQG